MKIKMHLNENIERHCMHLELNSNTSTGIVQIGGECTENLFKKKKTLKRHRFENTPFQAV
jgi:hypothetical protein